MNKHEFLKQLRNNLKALPESEIADILRDQEEFIADALRAGKTEEDVIAQLGDPKKFAASIIAESRLAKAEQAQNLPEKLRYTLKAFLAILILAPLNFLVFVGPFIALASLLFAGWCVAGAIIAAGSILLFAGFFKVVFMGFGVWAGVSFVAMSIGLVAGALAGGLLMYSMTRLFLKLIGNYIKWNISFVQAQAH